MDQGGVILPGGDLPHRARRLLHTRSAFIEAQGGAGSARVPRPRDVVARSWLRVLAVGLDPDGGNARVVVGMHDMHRRRRESSLAGVVDELSRVMVGVADASQMLLVVTDADGVILWREGTASVRRRADALGFAEGTAWTETRVGTNAIGTALAEGAPVQLFAAEHFERAQLSWYCAAAPVHDPRTGRLLGIVDVSGPALTLHPAVPALVEAARRLAEARLWRHHQQQLDRLRRAGAPVLSGAGGPALLVDDHGWVAQASGVAVGERIAVPSAERLVAVPGLGLCRPERLDRGWLVRPVVPSARVAATGRVVIDASLDVTGAAGGPVLEVTTGDVGWRRPVTTRHAEILLALHAAGPHGLTAAALSQALYGDVEHAVTARAEVSRLRRSVGALVDARPYRLAAGVRLTVHGPVDHPA